MKWFAYFLMCVFCFALSFKGVAQNDRLTKLITEMEWFPEAHENCKSVDVKIYDLSKGATNGFVYSRYFYKQNGQLDYVNFYDGEKVYKQFVYEYDSIQHLSSILFNYNGDLNLKFKKFTYTKLDQLKSFDIYDNKDKLIVKVKNTYTKDGLISLINLEYFISYYLYYKLEGLGRKEVNMASDITQKNTNTVLTKFKYSKEDDLPTVVSDISSYYIYAKVSDFNQLLKQVKFENGTLLETINFKYENSRISEKTILSEKGSNLKFVYTYLMK